MQLSASSGESESAGEAGEPARKAIGTAAVDSGALTEDAIPADGAPSTERDGRSSSVPGPPDSEPHSESAGQAAPQPPPVVSSPTPAPAGDQPEAELAGTAPPPDWHSQRSQRPRRIAIAVALAAGGLLSLLLLLAVLSRGGEELAEQPETPTVEDLQATAADTASNADDLDADDPGADDPGADQTRTGQTASPSASASSESPPSSAEDITESEADAEGDAASDDPPSAPGQPGRGAAATAPPAEADPARDGVDAPPAQDNPDATNPNASDPDTGDPQPPAELLPGNPLLPSDPLQGIFSSSEPDAEKEDEASRDASQLKELPEDLRGLFGDLNMIDRPQFADAAPAPPTIDEFQVDRAAEEQADLGVMLEGPEPINMRRALGMPLAMQAAEAEGYPLNDLLLVLSQVSGAPMDVQWVSLDLVGTPIDQRVALPSGWLTVEEILEKVCQRLQATFVPGDFAVTIRPTEERLAAALEPIIDFSDLGAGASSAIVTAQTLLGQDAGGSDKVALPEADGPRQVAALVCESIRRARRQPGKLPDPVVARWAGPFAQQVRAWPKLQGGESGPRLIQSGTLASIARRIARINGVTCFLNWQDVIKRGLTPTETTMPRTGEDVSAAEALEQVLDSEDLQVRVVDSEHWWIGSQASFDRFPVVVWFADAQDAKLIEQQLSGLLAGAADETGYQGRVTLDPESGVCIAVIPRYLLRQLPRLLSLGNEPQAS